MSSKFERYKLKSWAMQLDDRIMFRVLREVHQFHVCLLVDVTSPPPIHTHTHKTKKKKFQNPLSSKLYVYFTYGLLKIFKSPLQFFKTSTTNYISPLNKFFYFFNFILMASWEKFTGSSPAYAGDIKGGEFNHVQQSLNYVKLRI